MNNKRMHRQLTLQCVKIMQQVEEVGVYIPRLCNGQPRLEEEDIRGW